mmetsp:Transcript_90939/g.291624  ORF Transcript_90939/g.291624 Transcript_90939/m.291624 type:complete len:243 (+) Transcript_90939:3-731(+)
MSRNLGRRSTCQRRLSSCPSRLEKEAMCPKLLRPLVQPSSGTSRCKKTEVAPPVPRMDPRSLTEALALLLTSCQTSQKELLRMENAWRKRAPKHLLGRPSAAGSGAALPHSRPAGRHRCAPAARPPTPPRPRPSAAGSGAALPHSRPAGRHRCAPAARPPTPRRPRPLLHAAAHLCLSMRSGHHRKGCPQSMKSTSVILPLDNGTSAVFQRRKTVSTCSASTASASCPPPPTDQWRLCFGRS